MMPSHGERSWGRVSIIGLEIQQSQENQNRGKDPKGGQRCYILGLDHLKENPYKLACHTRPSFSILSGGPGDKERLEVILIMLSLSEDLKELKSEVLHTRFGKNQKTFRTLESNKPGYFVISWQCVFGQLTSLSLCFCPCSTEVIISVFWVVVRVNEMKYL